MGPFIDFASGLASQAIMRQDRGYSLQGSGRFGLALAAMMPLMREAMVHHLGIEAGVGLAGALLGGLSVRLASTRRASGDKEKQRSSLALEQKSFLAAADSSLDAFYVLDSVRDATGRINDFSFRYANLQAEQRFCHDRDTLTGMSYRKVMRGILDEEQFRQYCKVVGTGEPATIEFAVTAPNAKVSLLRHRVVKLGDGLAVTSTDLSELRSVQDRFQSVAEFSDMIFDHAPFSIIATNASGIITAVNLEAEGLTGYSSAELIERVSLLTLLDSDELRESREQIAREHGLSIEGLDLIAGPRIRNQNHPEDSRKSDLVLERECIFVRRDGTRIIVNLAIKPLWGSDGVRSGLIATAYDLGSRRQAEARIPPPAMHDPLTGLIGQGLLEDRIAQAIKRSRRASTKVAVLTIDLDHFKRINDALGHRIGDEILAVAAARLLDKVRSADTLARVGGDEFIIVISDQEKISDIEFCANLFLRILSAPFLVQEHTINVTASIGICISPDFAQETESLLRRSEAAMYSAKETGRNRIALFAPRMLEDAASRISMEGALRLALDNNELFLEYQPQVALPSGKVIGMEALLRWRHPRFGLVSPAHFIPIAERTGLLPEFGAWAMRRACRETKWIQSRLDRRVTLSINLSPNQFQQKKLLQTIQESLSSSGLAAADLEVEIIESTLMINSSANLETLQMIRDLGVHLSIDDFGTGFCNFNYLLQYQVDRLKIDQSFVRQAASDGSAASVVRTVIAMSHGLGIKIIAEGVETREQLKFLMRRRCDQAQGYYFARPLSPEQFVQTVPRIEEMNLNESGEHPAARKSGSSAATGALPNPSGLIAGQEVGVVGQA